MAFYKFCHILCTLDSDGISDYYTNFLFHIILKLAASVTSLQSKGGKRCGSLTFTPGIRHFSSRLSIVFQFKLSFMGVALNETRTSTMCLFKFHNWKQQAYANFHQNRWLPLNSQMLVIKLRLLGYINYILIGQLSYVCDISLYLRVTGMHFNISCIYSIYLLQCILRLIYANLLLVDCEFLQTLSPSFIMQDTYRRRQMQRTVTRQMSFDLTKLLVTEDWFSDISPQTMRRLLNIVSLTGSCSATFLTLILYY